MAKHPQEHGNQVNTVAGRSATVRPVALQLGGLDKNDLDKNEVTCPSIPKNYLFVFVFGQSANACLEARRVFEGLAMDGKDNL